MIKAIVIIFCFLPFVMGLLGMIGLFLNFLNKTQDEDTIIEIHIEDKRKKV